jgi:hypothetical protein
MKFKDVTDPHNLVPLLSNSMHHHTLRKKFLNWHPQALSWESRKKRRLRKQKARPWLAE